MLSNLNSIIAHYVKYSIENCMAAGLANHIIFLRGSSPYFQQLLVLWILDH